MKIIDTHTHCFPDALAPRAIAKLSEEYQLKPNCDGTLAGLLSVMDRDAIDCAFVLNVATNAHQQDKVNAFAAGINHFAGRIFAFGSLHPDYPDVKNAAKQIRESGLYGIKLHLDFIGMDIDDSRMRPIFSACAEYDLPIVIHSGYDPISPNHIHAAPEATAHVLKQYPSLRLCCAHLGDARDPEAVLRHLCGKNVWFDTGFTGLGLTREDTRKILDHHDENKVMFGSDMPWETPAVSIANLRILGLSPEREEKLFHKNAEAFLKLS